MRRIRIAMAQINTTMGDFAGNTRKILEAIAQSRALGVDLVTFPELAICGYPPEDLLLKPQFIQENLRSLDRVIEGSSGLTIILGFVDAREDIYNAAAVIDKTPIKMIPRKAPCPVGSVAMRSAPTWRTVKKKATWKNP